MRLTTIRSGAFKLMGERLFNIPDDPNETTDIARQNLSIVERLSARLDEVGKSVTFAARRFLQIHRQRTQLWVDMRTRKNREDVRS